MIDVLIDRIRELDNPTVVGLDPRLECIPTFIKEDAFNKYGNTSKAVADIFYEFCKVIIDSVYDLVPAVKPQIAMFEQFGHDGIKSYIDVINYAKKKGLIVIGDIKRSDITSTAEAYSNGHIGKINIEGVESQTYNQDFITLNPYLGYDSIKPYMDNCKKYKKGLFILVKTSNPNSGQLQDLDIGGEKLYERVGSLVSKWGEDLIGSNGYSLVGSVVGATHPEQGRELRKLMPNTFFLVPGYGAQGGTAKDLRGCFDKNGMGAIINSSRGIIAAYKDEKYKYRYSDEEFGLAAREAAINMKEDLLKVRS